MKKLISLLLALILSFSLSVPVFAAKSSTPNEDSSDVISFEEYDAAVKAKYAEHHIKYECTSYNKNFVFTKELLNQKLAEVDKVANGFTYDTSTNTFVDCKPILESQKNAMRPNEYRPNGYIGDVNHTISVTATSPSGMGWAQIQIIINTAEDIQLGRFVEINSCTSRQYGGALNFKSWKHKGNSLSINSSRTWVTGTVYGTLTVEYTEPTSGLRATYTSDHSWEVGITPG